MVRDLLLVILAALAFNEMVKALVDLMSAEGVLIGSVAFLLARDWLKFMGWIKE